MRVFVTGATGYIGFNVAQAFRRAGHEVFGLARSGQKAAVLVKNEIRPVMGNMRFPESYESVAAECSLLVHAAAEFGPKQPEMDRKTVETLLEVGGRGVRPKTFIYTSGVWVHGNTGCALVDETTPLEPAKVVTWRPAVEEMVLSANGVRGFVIRPGCVYGKQGGLTGAWFAAATRENVVTVLGDGKNHWSMVHIDDLTEGYRLVGESGLDGGVFAFAEASYPSLGEMARAAARVAGEACEVRLVPLGEAGNSAGEFAEALALDQHVDAGKAKKLLGWQPRHHGFIAEVETFFQSWRD